MSDKLLDTPNWSLLRRAVVVFSLLVGAVAFLMPGFVTVESKVAELWIVNGADMIVWIVGIYVGGATGERIRAWWPKRQEPKE